MSDNFKVPTPFFDITLEQLYDDEYRLWLGSYSTTDINVKDLEKLKSRIDMVIHYIESENIR